MSRNEEQAELCNLIKEFDHALHYYRTISNEIKEAKIRLNKTRAKNNKMIDSLSAEHCRELIFKRNSLIKQNSEAIDDLRRTEENLQASVDLLSQARHNLARGVGVPNRYLDNIYVDTNTSRKIYNIYFGGTAGPFSKNHGHYVIKRDGEVTYRREFKKKHGQHNYHNSGMNIAFANCEATQ